MSYKLTRFSMRALFLVTLIVCVGLTCVLAPRRAEFIVMKKLANDAEPFKDCTRGYYGWWDKRLEIMTGLPPCCISVTISGESLYWEDQLKAVSGLQSKNLRVYVDDFDGVSCPDLEWQNVTFLYATRASGEFVRSILHAVPRLETLTLYDCFSIEDDDLGALSMCPMLKNIDLDGTSIDGRFLSAFSNSPLEKLSIRYSNCCSRGTLKVLSNFVSLQDIYISGSGNFDFEWIRDLPALKEIVVEGFEVAENSVEGLKAKSPELRIQVLP